VGVVSWRFAGLVSVLRKEEGLTLAELLVTVALLGVLMIPVFNLLLSGSSYLDRAGSRTEAVNLAREKMEEIKAGAPGQGGFPEVEELEGYRRETKVSSPREKEVTRESGGVLLLTLREVEVEVFWEEENRERSLKMESFLAER